MKKKLLWIGDDPRSKSGYGRVLNEMLPYFLEEYELFILSIGYLGPSNNLNIIDSSDGTPFGFKSVVKYYNEIKPDLFILLNDHKIIWGWLSELKNNCDLSFCKIIPYVCTEYIGIPKSDMNIYNQTCDHILVMANFTGEEMKKQGCIIPYTRLSHGYPNTLKNIDKKEARRILNINEDTFVFYSGNRNQPRKRLDIIIRAYVDFLVKYPDDNLLLLMNCGLIDMGVNIPELYERLCQDNNIKNYESKIYYLNKTNESSKFNDDDLSVIYSCTNVGITTSTGESFGLIPFEMCLYNIPQIIPNFGGIIESIKDGSIKININDYYSYPRVLQSASGIGGIVHYKDVTEAMEIYYTKKDVYTKHCSVVKNNLINNSWKEVSNQCIQLLNKQLDIKSKYKIPSKELIEEYESLLIKYNYIFEKMNSFLKENDEILEGGCMYEHGYSSCIISNYSLNKQLNLYDLSKNSENILEIGFNLGNSALLFLLSNSKSKIICFDICIHKYVKLCFNYLDELFPNRLQLIEGDSTNTVPLFYEKKYDNYFDLIHIDGGHHEHIARQDFLNTYPMAKRLIIFDDDWLSHLNNLIQTYIQKNIVEEYYHFKSIKVTHKLLIKNKNLSIIDESFIDKNNLINNSREEVSNQCIQLLNKQLDIKSKYKIPKIIHQIWIGPKKPPYQFLNTWKLNHPDWEYILWTEDKLINEKFTNEYLINNIDIITVKSDLIRYELLYKYGGIYMDADIICKKKLDDFFLDNDLFSTYYNKEHNYITNSTIGSVKNNEVLKEIIDYFKNLTNIKFHDPVEFSVSPFSNILKNKQSKIYDYYYFNPIDFNSESLEVDNTKVYGVHFWGTTRSNMTSKKVDIYSQNVSIIDEKIIDKNNVYICTHDENDLISGELIKNNIWEQDITKNYIEILKTLNEDDLILDIGANLGYYSLIAASYNYNVLAFEPFEENYNKFESSILLNSFHNKIKIYKNIVSEKSHEKKSLKVVPGPIINYGCIKVEEEKGDIETIALDDFNINKNIGILKIDVEGHEYHVIQGCKNLIINNQVKNIIIEFSPKFVNINYCYEIARFLVLNSYYIYDFNGNQFTYDDLINDIPKDHQKDYLFVKSNFIPIQCINLKEKQERKLFITKQMNNLNIKYHLIFVDAINGNNINLDETTLISDFAKNKIKNSNKEHGHDMTLGSLGLIATTYILWKNLFKPCLIIEDDILFNDNFENVLNKSFNELHDDWDLFYLGYYHDPMTNIYKNNIYKATKIYGLFGYIINPESVNKIIKSIFPCDYQLDTEIHKKNNYNLNNYVVYPKLINHSGYFHTNIQIFDVDEKTINEFNKQKIKDNNIFEINEINKNLYKVKF